MTPYWSLRFFLGLNVLADACIAWADPLTRMAHLIDASGDVGWLVLAAVATASLMCVIDVLVNDFLPARYTLPASYEAAARAFFTQTEGSGYDLFGMARFVIAPLRGAGDKYWCSEWVAEALGLREPWRYGSNGLHAALSCLSPENPP